MSFARRAVRRKLESATIHINQTITMNIRIISYCATALLAASAFLQADEPGRPKAGSTDFERLKTLVGTWTGKTDMGQGPVDLTLQFRLIAGGSVLEEV